MTITHPHTRRARQAAWGGALIAALCLAPLAVPTAALAHDEAEPASGGIELSDPELTRAVTALGAPLDIRIPILNVPGDPSSGERDASSGDPWTLALSPDGRYAYVDNANYGQNPIELWVFDLDRRMHVKTLEVGDNPGGTSTIVAATSANVVAVRSGDSVYVIDSVANEIRDRWDLPRSSGYREAISPDGQYFYTVSSVGLVQKLNLDSGEIEASRRISVKMMGTIEVTPDGNSLAIGEGYTEDANYRLLSAATLEDLGPAHSTPTIWQYSRMRFDAAGTALYQTDFGTKLNKLDPVTGQSLQEVAVGTKMSGLVPNPEQNRAWGTSIGFSLVMVADYTTGKRSESFRSVPGGSIDLAQRPNGELVAPNGAKGKRGPDMSISVLLPAAVTQQPADVTVETVDEEAVFTAEVQGIKADAASGVTWQRSDDAGETWVDLDAHGLSLEVPATRETVAAQFRLAYTDDFWGVAGASDAARIVAPAPEILDPVTEISATAGTEIAPVSFTARAQEAHEWSVDGLPEGLALDAATGELSGMPAVAGEFSATVSVSDDFGVDVAELSIAVSDPAGDPDPKPGPGTDPAPGEDPSDEPGAKPAPGSDPAPGDTPAGDQPATKRSAGDQDLARTGGTELIGAGLLGAGLILAGLVTLKRRRA